MCVGTWLSVSECVCVLVLDLRVFVRAWVRACMIHLSQ